MRKSKMKPIIERHMEAHGLFDKRWKYKFGSNLHGGMADGTPVNAMAICSYRKRTLYFDPSKISSKTQLEQTVIHEIAHYKVGPQGHTEKWYESAKSMGYSSPWTELERTDEAVAQKRKAYRNQLRADRGIIIGGFAAFGALLVWILSRPEP
jgi:hypothetical protein